MSEADKMFEELGYEMTIIDQSGIDTIIYRKPSQINPRQIIEFNNRDKELYVHNVFVLQELKAINKKVEELGWNE